MRKSAGRLFFLSLFAAWGPQAQCDHHGGSEQACVISPKAIVSDACATYSTLEQVNNRDLPALDDLVRTTDFFSHWRLNLFHKTCPFWSDENGMCGNVACAVETLDNEDDIPLVWRASELGKLEGPLAKHPAKCVQRERRPERAPKGELGENVDESCVMEYDADEDHDDGGHQRDYCVPEDEEALDYEGDYVSLLRNPERYTGYTGDGARQVWNAIYRENCFQKSSFPHSANLGESPNVPWRAAAMDFKAVMEAAGRQQVLEQERQENPLTPFVAQTGLEYEDECLEKRVFYRVMSGMHASISTHLCWEFLNKTKGTWEPNVMCYRTRLHEFPDRISNLYFNYALLTRAIAKLGPYLAAEAPTGHYSFCPEDAEQDAATRAKVLAVTEAASSVPHLFDESLMFKNGEGPSLKEDFRNRFRNVSRLMDCVGCDKCRLWGKLQAAGYGAALKVLFEFDNSPSGAEPEVVPRLKRTELVALFNTYGRLSHSLSVIQKLRKMVEAEDAAARETRPDVSPPIPDRARKPHQVVVDGGEKRKAAEGAGEKPTQKLLHEQTLKEQFDAEFALMIKALKFVLGSWAAIPFNVYQIASSELHRLWQFYIGLPITPRNWRMGRPNLNEL